MPKSSKQHLLNNLSVIKYRYHNIFETALAQLDHMFCTVGKGIDYDPSRGLLENDFKNRKSFFIAEHHNYDFDEINSEREKEKQALNKEYDRWKTIFGDEIPVEITNRFNKDIENLEKPFSVLDESYYFTYNKMAREMVEHVRGKMKDDPHSRLEIRTPYPLSEKYSNVCLMTQHDNPLMVELAYVMCNAWLLVLEYYIEQEWYYTDEEVEKYGATTYHQSLTYINKSIDDFKRLIKNLRKHND